MTTYLDVRVARIQQYLDLSSTLAERRYASYAVVAATDEGSLVHDIRGLVPHGEAGNVDGVLHLALDTERASEDSVDVEALANRVLAWVRERLPSAQLEAWWCTAGTYESASTAARSREFSRASLADQEYGRLDWLPAPVELPVARRCDACRGGAAVAEHDLAGGRSAWLCVDCEMRQAGRLFRWRGVQDAGQPLPVPQRERKLREALNERFGNKLKLADSFTDLRPNWDIATSREGRRDDTPSGRGAHHATIAFDGNSFGAFFGNVKGSSVRRVLSSAISDALTEALITAGVAVHMSDDRTVLVQPHVQGGDDLLVTVWAPRAWSFMLTFLESFNVLSEEAVKETGLLGLRSPALSAGVVFAHDSFPFSHSREIAEDLLAAAKREHPAHDSAIGWLDVTEDGDRPVEGRPSLLLADARAWSLRLDTLAAIPHAQRTALRSAAAASGVRALAQAQRNAILDQIDPFLAPGAPLRLTDALTLTRWWLR